jgi:carboxypeptidase T
VHDNSPTGTARSALASLAAAVVVLSALLVPAAPPAAAPAQTSPADTRLVRVRLGPALPLDSLLAGGFDIVSLKRDVWADLYVHPGDEERLQLLGVAPQVLDDAVERHFAERAELERSGRPQPAPARLRSAVEPDGIFRIEALPPFGSGSMGGYWTLAEIKMKLDSLVASDTRDLVADKLDTLGTTVQGRPIWGLRLGKRMDAPDRRPAVVLNALTHAREPEGMQTLFCFVDDLLSRYDTDSFARYLLDQRVIYICPLVNPDGYYYNQTISPGGGGSWRKNRRNNGTSYGVDLNRNFGFKWGYDNLGSSPTATSETYRGPSAFSEPETQAQRDLVNSLKPVTGLSFHSYSDLFVHPWGYATLTPPDSMAFWEWNDEATRGSPYFAGEGPRILYATNGDFNDWTYGDTVARPRCFSWTPEIGTEADGFWPAPSRIVPLALENLQKCYTVAAIAGPYVRIESSSLAGGELIAGLPTRLAVRARNLGLAVTPANLTATLSPLDAGAEALPGGATVPFPALPSLTSGEATGGATFLVGAADTVTLGRMLRFEVAFTADGGYFSRDTVELLVGRPTTVLLEPCEALTNWAASSGWGVVSTDARHPDRYATDSPSGDYPNYANLRLTYKGRLDLSKSQHAYAFFEARWLAEQTYDGTVVEASLDSVTWTPLAGRGTSAGIFSPQPAGKPIYQATRYLWKTDRLDLSAFAGPAGGAVRLRLRTLSDAGVTYDGFSFDSLRVLLFDPAQQPVPTAVGPEAAPLFELAAPWPNPARSVAHLGIALPRAASLRLEIYDLQGRRVRTLASGRLGAGRYALAWDLRDDAGRPVAPGIYLARLSGEAGDRTRRIVLLP